MIKENPNNNLPTLKQVVKQFNLSSKKSLGQHFLLDSNLCSKLATFSGSLKTIQ